MTAPIETSVLADGLTLEICDDVELVAEHGASWLANTMTRVVSERGRCVLAVSGGRSPWPMFRLLAAMPQVPWSDVHIVQVDEREAADGDPARNWTTAGQVFGHLPEGHLHPMPVAGTDRTAAASQYARLLEQLCNGAPDICHLGLGDDGHTASLFPGDDVLDVVDRRVAWTTGQHAGHHRMSLTLPALNGARYLLWQVLGNAKQAMLARLLRGDRSIPAGRVRRDTALVLADREARGAS